MALQRFALAFVSKQLPLADIVAHLQADPEVAPLTLDAHVEQVVIQGKGYTVRVERVARLGPLMKEANEVGGARLNALRRCSMVLVQEYEMTEEYEETVWDGGGRPLPWQAIAVCECLNRLPGALTYDLVLGYYPEASAE
jgi:hypothetical protein